MLKKIFASLALVVVFGGIFYLFFPRQDILKTPLECDLNLKDCVYSFKGREVLVSLEPKPIEALKTTTLKIKNLGTYQNLEFKIYGLNMFMGEIQPKLIRLKEDYESEIFTAACFLETMRFRAEFMENNKPIGFYFDFEVRR